MKKIKFLTKILSLGGVVAGFLFALFAASFARASAPEPGEIGSSLPETCWCVNNSTLGKASEVAFTEPPQQGIPTTTKATTIDVPPPPAEF